MFFERMKIVHLQRILVVLLLLAFVFTSSSVYADSTSNMTLPSDASTSSVSTENVKISDTLVKEDDSFSSSQIVIAENTTPLVQSMTQSAADSSTLYQETAANSFFEHTVFVGDSLSVGFANYCLSHEDSIATDSTYFLAKESCSAKIAISSDALTTHANVMPSYQGSVQYIEDAIAQMTDVEKVFVCFGMNDLVSSTPQQYINDMQTLLERILAKSPNVTFYLISIPCIIEDTQAGNLSNDSISAANSLLELTCRENGWGFINLAEYLMNQNLAIRVEYSSDGYVHENNAAYEIWVKVLRNYAYEGMTSE